MNTNTTPGPWSLDASTGPIRVIAKGVVICDVAPHRGGVGMANGRQIAASPAMLDALLAALSFVEDAEQDPGYRPGYAASIAREIRAAIKSATEEP
ncbi:hypothetical protein ACMHYJ_14280 [Castellaniella hirudinis]|uniref:hypothetical protein n=1 Tax=Castellaniella hirudinis TaxID=1144617 RepID=UPI0039C448D4